MIKSASKISPEESPRIILGKARYRKRNRCGWAQR